MKWIAALSAQVTLTDLARILPLLEEGISLNPGLGEQVRALPLTWGCAGELGAVCTPTPPDLICVSDCVYYEASLAPLVFTLRHVSTPHPHHHSNIFRQYKKADVSNHLLLGKARIFCFEKLFEKRQYVRSK